jgi:hypothetical protein
MPTQPKVAGDPQQVEAPTAEVRLPTEADAKSSEITPPVVSF